MLAVAACNQNHKGANDIEAAADQMNEKDAAQLEKRNSMMSKEFKDFKIYPLTSVIKKDMNGDSIEEFIVFSIKDGRNGITITNGASGEIDTIGFGNSFGYSDGNFQWVDFWGITNDPETFEITPETRSQAVLPRKALENPGLVLRKDSYGGGLITYEKTEYVWVHQHR